MIQNIIDVFKQDRNLSYVLLVFLFIFVFLSMFYMLKRIMQEKIMIKYIKSFIDKTEANYENRKKIEEEEIIRNGTVEKEGLLTKFDHILDFCGIKTRLSFINAESFFILTAMLCIIIFILTIKIEGLVIYGILSVFITLISVFLGIFVLYTINYKKTEQNIFTFMNLLSNYSRSSSDIINIMGQIYDFLDEPLHSQVKKCYDEGIHTGDVQYALENLSKAIEHKHLKMIIKNISVCSQFENNYEDVVQDSRQMLQEYLAGKEVRKEIYNAGKANILIIAGFSFLIFFILQRSFDIDVINGLANSTIGNFLAIMYLAMIGFSIFAVFVGDFKKD